MAKYQGREFQSTLQAPDSKSLSTLIRSARKYARENRMEDFHILEKGKDPDGGYRAIVTAHNWNPISWIKEKISGKKKPPAEIVEEGMQGIGMTEEEIEVSKIKLLETASPEKTIKQLREELDKTQTRAGTAEEATKLYKEAQEKASRMSTMWRTSGSTRGPSEPEGEYGERVMGSSEAGKMAKPRKSPILSEEELSKLSWGQRRQYKKKMGEAEKSRTEEAYEIWKGEAPEQITSYQKILQKEYWTKKGTDIPATEPRTAEERAETDYHPSQWSFIPVTRQLTPAEKLRIARAQEYEKMELDVTREKYKQFKRERKPIYRVAKAAGGFGTFMAGAVTMGVAGMARGARPGKGGPERAMRMHAPGLPLDLYAVRPVLGVGMPSAKDLTGAGLENLRALTFPGIRKTKKQVQQVRRQVEP